MKNKLDNYVGVKLSAEQLKFLKQDAELLQLADSDVIRMALTIFHKNVDKVNKLDLKL
jgi:cyclopropane fatty-acyl-phospholipid synthase-like methyltransferase